MRNTWLHVARLCLGCQVDEMAVRYKSTVLLGVVEWEAVQMADRPLLQCRDQMPNWVENTPELLRTKLSWFIMCTTLVASHMQLLLCW